MNDYLDESDVEYDDDVWTDDDLEDDEERLVLSTRILGLKPYVLITFEGVHDERADDKIVINLDVEPGGGIEAVDVVPLLRTVLDRLEQNHG